MTDRVARVRLPDGRIAKLSVPEGTSQQEVLTHAENLFGRGVTSTEDFGPEPMSKSMESASKEMGFGKSVIAGLGMRLADFDARIRQVLGGGLTAQDQQAIQAGRSASGPVAAGRVAADVGLSLATPAGGLPGSIAAGAAQRFMTDPVLEGESGAQNALQGAIGSALGYSGMKVAQGLVRPITPSPQVEALAREGVIPTIGEAAAATGTRTGRAVGRMEEAGTSTFGIGQGIGYGRERALREMRQAAFRRATPQGATPTTRDGREGLQDTYDAISGVYENALTRIGIVRADQQFAPDIQRRVNQAVMGLPRGEADDVRNMVRDIIANRESPVVGAYPADIAKRVDEDLGARIRDFSNQQSGASGRITANALRAAQQAWRDLIRRNAPDQATRDMLDDANRAFANYVRVERAVGDPGAVGGQFNANQLSRAVRATSRGAGRKSQYARGDALMEDLSDPAKAVLSDKLGESGTVPRAAMMALLSGGLGAGAVGNEQLGGPSALTALLAAAAAGPALYSRAFSRYAIGDLIPGQNTAATFLSGLAPYSAGLGRLYQEEQQ